MLGEVAQCVLVIQVFLSKPHRCITDVAGSIHLGNSEVIRMEKSSDLG